MKLLVISCSLLLSAVSATNFGTYAAVLTSEDVWNGRNSPGLTNGANYRVYTVYASNGDKQYASKVAITGAGNIKFDVATLATPKGNAGYILEGNNVLTAPITITDSNPTTARSERMSFTIYFVLVSDSIPASPVVSAQFSTGQITCSGDNSRACTVLSAEKNFQLESIDTGAGGTIIISNSGFDASKNDYTVMSVNPQTAAASFTLISGPIATLWGSNQPFTYNFFVRKGAAYSGSIRPGATTTFLSKGYISPKESYSMSYSGKEAQYRSIDFGKETQVSVIPVSGNLNADDTMQIICNRDNGKPLYYDGRNGGAINEWCKVVTLTLTSTRNTDEQRFMVQVVSGASSMSLFAVLIFSLLGRLFG